MDNKNNQVGRNTDPPSFGDFGVLEGLKVGQVRSVGFWG